MFLSFLLQTAPPASPLGSFGTFLPILLIFGIFYFLLFMPMQRQKKQQQKMLAALQNGNEVLTTGGIIGTIVSIEDDRLVLRVKPNDIKIQVSRSAISSLLSGETKSSEVKK